MTDRDDLASLRGDLEVARLRLEAAHAEIERLRLAIRRLADQDATLSVVRGNVVVEIDATLTDAEREAVESAAYFLRQSDEAGLRCAATLRGLLERMSSPET